MTDTMRFGLVGTGPWAHDVHGPGLLGAEEAQLVGVWGRSPDKATALAGDLGVRPFDDLDALLGSVDAAAFAVPPDVQAELALRAARAGKHLLLDKPVATTARAARDLAATAVERGSTALVFFTDRFTADGAAWHDDVSRTEGWRGGDVQALATLDAPDNPFGDSPWRRERGALWDIGPHALSNLIGALGPVSGVTGVRGAGDLVHLVLQHENGATSTATLTLFAPTAAATQEVRVWGEAGVSRLPVGRTEGPAAAFSRAVGTLVACARTGAAHPADLRLGVRVVELLEEIQAALDAPASAEG